MAEVNPQDRHMPFLLDRLQDDEPHVANESRDRRSHSMRRLRDSVLRDLRWLLNARCHVDGDGLDEFPLVARSVVNFGVPDLTGLTASQVPAIEIERMVRRAIEAYEPRILRASLQVRITDGGPGAREAAAGGPAVVHLEIRADIWSLPTPEHLLVWTDLDLETGNCRLRDGPPG